MGNRALVVFTDGKGDFSPAVYLHWHGYNVPELLATWWKRMEGRTGDVGYGSARFCGIAHEAIDGNMSLGLLPLDDPKDDPSYWRENSHGDAGVFVVNCCTGRVERHHGSVVECGAPRVFQAGETKWTEGQWKVAGRIDA